MKLIEFIPALIKTARQAGDAILEIYNHAADFGIEQKADRSPLTLADKASNELICNRLNNLPEVFPIISEENKITPFEQRKTWQRCWLVDPLDGTKEFIKRNGDFTVNIALVENGRPILGIVHAPVSGELCWGALGEGAFLVKNQMQMPLECAPFRLSDSNLNVVCSRSHLTAETEAFIAQFHDPNLVSRGSSLKFLLLAKGDAHVYPRIAPTMEWDTAAAQIILEEAGGKLLHFDTGEPLRYNKENLLNPAFVAWGKILE